MVILSSWHKHKVVTFKEAECSLRHIIKTDLYSADLRGLLPHPSIHAIYTIPSMYEGSNHPVQFSGCLDGILIFWKPVLGFIETQVPSGKMPKCATASGL